ncbi:MAG: CvpA family protein, partial [Ruminococcus sp.]|nr:CvpA family protein [Ruminococcus sp.]
MFYDIIVIAIIIISIVIGYNRGAANTLVSLFGFILSFVIAVFLGDFLSEFIYNSYLSEAIINSVSSCMVTSGTGELIVTDLPPFVDFAMKLTGFDYNEALQSSISDLSNSIAVGFETAIKPVVLSVLTFVLTALVFIIIYFVFRLILKSVLNFVFNLPLLRGINKTLGAVFSLLSSLCFVSFMAFLLNIIMPYIENIPYWLSESTIYNS